MDRGKPLQEGVRVKLPADDLGAAGGDDPDQIRDQNSIRRGSTPCRTPTTSTAALSFRLRDRRDQAAGRARPEAVRYRFDLSITSWPSFPAIYLTRAPIWVILAGQAGLADQLLPAVQRRPDTLTAGRAAPVADPSRSSSSTPLRIAARDTQPRRGLLDCHSNGHQNGATHPAQMLARSSSATASRRCRSRRRHSAALCSQRALKTIEISPN